MQVKAFLIENSKEVLGKVEELFILVTEWLVQLLTKYFVVHVACRQLTRVTFEAILMLVME
jgi:hypothetical protein